MQQFLESQNSIKQRISFGTSMCPQKQYPLMLFKCGLLFAKISDISKVFSFVETIEYLSAQNKLTQTLSGHLLVYLYQNPHSLKKLQEIVDKLIKNKPVNIVLELQRLQEFKQNSNNQNGVKTSVNIKQNLQEIARQKNFERNGTMMMEQNKKTVDNEDNISQKTQKYDEQYFQNVVKMNLESEALAKKLQQQQQQLAKQQKQFNNDQCLCQICYVGLYDEEFLPLQACQHIFHKNCLSQFFKQQISQNRFPLKCPSDKCKMEVKDFDIKQILASQLYQKYEKHTLKHYADMHGDSISWCPTADCQYMFFYEKDDNPRFQCLECKKQYCLNCRAQWHKDMTCKQYQISNTHNADDEAFIKFVKGKKFKQCPKCKFWVEKNEGCDHMTCKCKFQFCYKCGGIYMKCECVTKMQEQMERRRQQIAERRKKKLQTIQKKRQKKQQKVQAEQTRQLRSKRRR